MSQAEVDVDTESADPITLRDLPGRYQEKLNEIESTRMTPEDFQETYRGTHKDELKYDPMMAKYMELFKSLDMKTSRRDDVHSYRHRNRQFELNEEEIALFKKNGFVVCKRFKAHSFGSSYSSIYSDDLPVFITTDSILHAWHWSFDSCLASLESSKLFGKLNSILSGMHKQCPEMKEKIAGNDILTKSLEDCEFFLSVALDLLTNGKAKAKVESDERMRKYRRHNPWGMSDDDDGEQKKEEKPEEPEIVNCFDSTSVRQAETIEAIKKLVPKKFNLFGRERDVDFSQFKTRGHYNKTEDLKAYFQAMMWLGRIDLRISASHRELGCAAMLFELIRQAGLIEAWIEFDTLLSNIIGDTDSMNFTQLQSVLERADMTIESITSEDDLKALQEKVNESSFGAQAISGHIHSKYIGDKKPIDIPKSFTFMGQKFTLDSWVLDKVCWDRVKYNGEEVHRRKPSALDVAFSVFGNNAAADYIYDRISNKDGEKFRDGLPYHQTLAATRNVIDSASDEIWSKSLYSMWLNCLRALSLPCDHGSPTFHTKAWAAKDINTQLGSYTQLKHDTILYTKQSYGGSMLLCDYPDGFVEPKIQFWRALEDMCKHAGKILNGFFDDFARTVETIRGIAETQLADKELNDRQSEFLKRVVTSRGGGSGPPTYSGWYLRLFYDDDGMSSDFIVSDIHTNPPSEGHGDPGSILHEGMGKIRLCVVSVQNQNDQSVSSYVGPVFSHHEFHTKFGFRMSDQQWKNGYFSYDSKMKPPKFGEWTKAYMA